MPPLIEARGLAKRFGTQVALDHVGAKRIGALSKRVKTMVHLALTMTIDARPIISAAVRGQGIVRTGT